MVSGEGVLDVEIEKVGARVDGWIASLPQNMKLQVSPRFLLPHFAPVRATRVFDRAPCSSAIAGSWLGDENFLVYRRPALTKFYIVVTAGPPCIGLSQTRKKTATRP